jgi:hypothetical protein
MQFLNEKERNELFGSVIKPDRMKIPTAAALRESHSNPGSYQEMMINQANAN